jgi:hypothetical protein
MTTSTVSIIVPTTATAVAAPYGAAGPLVAGTSTTPNSIDTVTIKTFTIAEYNRSFFPGTRLRMTAVGFVDTWLEGVVTAWDGEIVSIDGDLASGTGTYSNWQINVAGEPGQQGPTGPQGADGPAGGPAGPQGAPGTPGAVWRNGNGAPLNSLGADGDYYLDDLTGDVYFRAASVYTIVANITGAPGATGATGAPGPQGPQGIIPEAPTDGAFYSRRNAAWATPPGGGDVSSSRTLTAGAGLTGGGDLTANRVFDVGAGTGLTVNIDNVALTVPVAVVNGGTGSTNAAAALNTLGAAPLASPVFTGDPQAPTAATTDADTSLATTAFVHNVVATSCWSPPQGRLTLQSATPVMTATQASKNTIYYTPYVGNTLPLYNGSTFASTLFNEISVLTTDTTKNPAAIGTNNVNDWFVWNDAGTLRLTHGPDWTNDTTRSAGTALVKVNGFWLNNVSITNGPAAQRGTWVGTTRSDASSLLNWIFGGAAVGGTAAVFGVFNAYNARRVMTQVIDTVGNFAVGNNQIIPFNNSNNNRVSFVCGLQDNFFSARFQTQGAAGTGGVLGAGVGYNANTVYSGSYVGHSSTTPGFCGGEYVAQPFGFNYFHAMCSMQAGSTNATFYGNAAVPLYIQAGLTSELWL